MFHWIDVLVHKTCTALINIFELDGKWGWAIRVTLAGCWAASMICVLHGIRFVATDLHIRFWLSGWPLCTLLGNAVMLFFLFVVAVSMELLTFSRHKSTDASAFQVTCVEPMMRCCRVLHKELHHRVLQRMCIAFFVFSIAVTVFGVNTAARGAEAADVLLERCGGSAASRELEATWKKLDTFYQQCDPQRKIGIRSCPGFKSSFPPPAPMVRYLEVLETTRGCSGFCKFGAKPLFTPGQGVGAHSQFPMRCASVVGEEMRRVSLGIGVPSAAFGCAIAMMAFCLFSFDNL